VTALEASELACWISMLFCLNPEIGSQWPAATA
jgi:hypothetical protein